MRFVLQVTTVMATFSACTLLAACDPPAEADAIAGSGPSPVVNPVLADAPLVRYQSELLDLAFETATVIPIEPHIKDRSRAQEGVVAACIELAQPVRAVGYTEQIDNWRRGSAYGDLALFCARLGYTEEAQEYLTLRRAGLGRGRGLATGPD